jgi:hypothetical protein
MLAALPKRFQQQLVAAGLSQRRPKHVSVETDSNPQTSDGRLTAH